MEISFRTRRLEKALSSQGACVKKWGPENARVIMKNLDQIASAETMADLSSLKQLNVHPLRHRKNEYSADAKYPYRIIFSPVPRPLKDAAGLRAYETVTRVEILRVEDTHG